jgi:hypothetical protein
MQQVLRVFRGVDFLVDNPSEFIAIDEEPNHQVMQLICFGKTDRPTIDHLIRVLKLMGLLSIFCVFWVSA